VRPSDLEFATAVEAAISGWETNHGALPGLTRQRARDCFIRQLVDSDRRRRFLSLYPDSKRLTNAQADPSNPVFNPYAAAVLAHRCGDTNEALWITFLAIHFGKHPVAHWRYLQNVYGCLGAGRWDWPTISGDPTAFRIWLANNLDEVQGALPRGFGNHRKRETLRDSGTGEAIESYVDWIGESADHVERFASIIGDDPDPGNSFEMLYGSMRAVFRFGRLARLDYLTTAHRLGLIQAEAGRPYLPESSGPLKGARELFGPSQPAKLELQATEFGRQANIPFAVLEDAICNWQKSPLRFRHFGG